MVSPLSARLLSLSAIASISGNIHSRNSSACSTASNDSVDSSGSAGQQRVTYLDRQLSLGKVVSEAHSSVSREDGNCSGNFVSRCKRAMDRIDANDSAKRLKIAETQYAAATAKFVLESAGMPSQPTLGGARSGRVLPLGSVDMSNIKLQSSSQNSSPPLKGRRSTSSIYECDMRLFSEAIQSTRPFYRFPRTRLGKGLANSGNISSKVSRSPAIPSEDESLTGSDDSAANSTGVASDTESDDSQENSIALGIPARLEDTIGFAEDKLHASKNITFVSKQESKLLIKQQSISALMSLGDALMSCSTARVVTQATPPFLIVHANAAYARLTGISSDLILGKPISTTLVSSQPQELSLANCAEMSSMGKEIFVRLITQSNRNNEKSTIKDDRNRNKNNYSPQITEVTVKGSSVCQMNVLPVVPDDVQHTAISSNGAKYEDSATIDLSEVKYYTVEIHPLNILSRIKKGEMKSEHDAIYKELCSDISENYECKNKKLDTICKSDQKQGIVVVG
eukprot:2479097-Ditylum_brightwellii.AAC.1